MHCGVAIRHGSRFKEIQSASTCNCLVSMSKRAYDSYERIDLVVSPPCRRRLNYKFAGDDLHGIPRGCCCICLSDHGHMRKHPSLEDETARFCVLCFAIADLIQDSNSYAIMTRNQRAILSRHLGPIAHLSRKATMALQSAIELPVVADSGASSGEGSGGSSGRVTGLESQ